MITKEDFFQKQVIRINGYAEIIFDYDNERPIRLIGFITEKSLPDIDVLIQGYNYYVELINHTQKIKQYENIVKITQFKN